MTFGLEHGAFPRASRLWRPGARARKKRHEKVFFPREPLTNRSSLNFKPPKGRSPTVMEVFVTCWTRTKLCGLRRLHAWETRAVLRGVPAVSARQGEVLVRGVRAEALTAQALAPAGA